MAPPSRLLLLLLQLLCWTSAGLACFCERYPWSSWSACTNTCNHGVQNRHRYRTGSDSFCFCSVSVTAANKKKPNYIQILQRSSSHSLCSLTGTSSIQTAITGKTAATSCARDTTAGLATSTVAQSTACSQTSGPGPSAPPASRNRYLIALNSTHARVPS